MKSPTGGGGGGDERSQHPTDHLLRELIATRRAASLSEMAQVHERLATAPFDPRPRRMPSPLRGQFVDGDPLGERAESLLVHLAQRIAEGQWAEGTTRGQYLDDLRRTVRRADARVLVYERRGGAIAAALADNDLPPSRLGHAPQRLVFVVYSADRGIVVTGYQTSGLHTLDIPGDARWLT